MKNVASVKLATKYGGDVLTGLSAGELTLPPQFGEGSYTLLVSAFHLPSNLLQGATTSYGWSIDLTPPVTRLSNATGNLPSKFSKVSQASLL